MFQKIAVLFLVFTCSFIYTHAQQATIKGVLRDEQGKIIESATVAVEGTSVGTQTDGRGFYSLKVPSGKDIDVVYSFVGYDVQHRKLYLYKDETREVNITMQIHTLQEVKKVGSRANEAGNIAIDVSKVHEMADPTGGIEALLKTYVGSHNELTSQYSVRGGNYDENLVYVNDFQIYRPFLVPQGQAEGLSFINPDLVSSVNFSVGGFQAKYGDKMSSVLDVTYKQPTEFAGSVMLSLLGASLSLEGASRNHKLTYLFGARQKSDQYLLQAQPTQGVYNPSFTDIQGLINYEANKHWSFQVLGNYARNRFTYFPEFEATSFGVVNQAYQLQSFFTGSERDQFDTRFVGVSATYKSDSRWRLKLMSSGYQANEYHNEDISDEYLLGQLQTDLSKNNFGQVQTYLGTGIIQDFTRDDLQVNNGDFGVRGSYDGRHNFIQFGADVSATNLNYNLHEWERHDSGGYTQPYNPGLLTLTYLYNGSNDFTYAMASAFAQDNFRLGNDSTGVTGCFGARFTHSFLNNENIVSPRLQLAWQPHGDGNIIYRFATGLYAQPPFYREMLNLQGDINKGLLAQKSYQTVLGVDYNFKMYNRPFKVTGELYYKDLWDIDPYLYNDVQINYTGKNDARGYAYGGEIRLYGDLVKDATSWVSIGIMKASERLTDSAAYTGYFPSPSDQRFMLGMYFEDYLPHNKNFKMHLNVMYATGLPTGPPQGHIYADTLRFPDYKRVDIGFSALLFDKMKGHNSHSLLKPFKTIWASLEIFNLLGIQNTISNRYIQDESTQPNLTFAVPNYLTTRLFNLKLMFNF